MRTSGFFDRHDWLASDEGTTAAEYAIIASMIAAVVGAIVLSLGVRVSELFLSLLTAWPG